MEVLELTSTLGIHASNIGVPLLLEVLEEEGLRDGPAPLDERQEQLKAEFTANRGYWHEFWDGMLELDPDLFEAYIEFSSVPWKTGTLEPKVKELVYIAFDASATHLYVPGLKLHMRTRCGWAPPSASSWRCSRSSASSASTPRRPPRRSSPRSRDRMARSTRDVVGVGARAAAPASPHRCGSR